VRAQISRLLAVFVVVAVLGAAVPSAASASTARAAQPTRDYCNDLVDYYTVNVVIAFIGGLAQAFSGLGGSDSTTSTTEPFDPEEFRAAFYAAMSPKLEALTARLADEGIKVLRKPFRQQEAVFAKGVALLKAAGLTDKQIKLIANAKIDSQNAQIEDLTKKVKLDDAKLANLGKDFKDDLAQLDQIESGPKVAKAFSLVGSQCGAFPSDRVDCSSVLPASDASQILGEDATRATDEQACEYRGAEPSSGGSTPTVAVAVYDGALAYDTLTRGLTDGKQVKGLGNPAVAVDGFNSAGHTQSCGRTLFETDRKHTVGVAICLAQDAPVSNDILAQTADQVFRNLS